MTGTVLVLLILLAALLIALLAYLFVGREPWYLDEAPESFRALQRAYEKMLRTLKDIEFDHQVGTLSADEHLRLKAEYKKRAVAIRGALERSRLACVRRIAAGQSASLSAVEKTRIEELVKNARASHKELIKK